MVITLHQGEPAESQLLEAVFHEVSHFSPFSPFATLVLLLLVLLLVPVVTSILVAKQLREFKRTRNDLR